MDYSLPQYDGMYTLILASECRPDIPFIFVSGAMGEDAAIEALTRVNLSRRGTSCPKQPIPCLLEENSPDPTAFVLICPISTFLPMAGKPALFVAESP